MSQHVIFTRTHVTDGGHTYKANDKPVSVDDAEARLVVHLGRGRYADAPTEAADSANTTKKEQGR